MEKWDLYDCNRNLLHKTHYRGDLLNLGEYHIVVGVWTVNSQKEILLTLRHPDKEEYPNKWENTSGSVLAGESSVQAAQRELVEETGIICCTDELHFLGSKCEESAFFDTFLLYRDLNISDLRMQPGETVAAKWVTIPVLETMIKDQSLAIPVGQRFNFVKETFMKFF